MSSPKSATHYSDFYGRHRLFKRTPYPYLNQSPKSQRQGFAGSGGMLGNGARWAKTSATDY